jgi:uncharacterized protein YceK
MKLNQSQLITILMVVLAICTGILLSGCASIGDGKDAGPKMESPQQIDKQSTAVEETSASSPEVRKEPVVNTGVNTAGSGEKSYVQQASLKGDEDGFEHTATYLMQALERILPATLPEMNWNRIATVLVGILVILMIYGLAFGLARLARPQAERRPSRGRSTDRGAR